MMNTAPCVQQDAAGGEGMGGGRHPGAGGKMEEKMRSICQECSHCGVALSHDWFYMVLPGSVWFSLVQHGSVWFCPVLSASL